MSSILALETSTEFCSVALLHGEQHFARSLHAGQSHSALILAMVREVLDQAQLKLDDCDALAFGAGPGSFTGLRIACAVVQGLAYGADLPVLAVSSLTAMVEQSRMESELASGQKWREGSRVLSALDARMGELYWSVLAWRKGEWHEEIVPSLDAPADLPIRIAHAMDRVGGLTEPLKRPIDYACGNACRIFAPALLPLAREMVSIEVPHATWIAHLAARSWQRGEAQSAHEVAPLYVRNQVALTTQERSAKTPVVPLAMV